MPGGLIEKKTFTRIVRAVRKVESDGTDLRGSRAGRRPQVTSSVYENICKVIYIDDTTLNIVDGFSDNYDTETVAGNLQINKFNFELPAQNFVINNNFLIYIESSLVYDDGVTKPATGATAEIKTTTDTTLIYEADIEKTLISRVLFSGGKITKYSQENVNPRILVIGEC